MNEKNQQLEVGGFAVVRRGLLGNLPPIIRAGKDLIKDLSSPEVCLAMFIYNYGYGPFYIHDTCTLGYDSDIVQILIGHEPNANGDVKSWVGVAHFEPIQAYNSPADFPNVVTTVA